MTQTDMTGADLKRMLVGTPITQGAIAKKLGWDEPKLSKALNEDPLPDGLADRFRQAFVDLAKAQAKRLLAAARAED